MKSAGDRRNHAKHSLVLWPFHGVFGSGPTLDETFGLIDTAEKSAEVLVKVLSMGGMKQTITRDELIALGKRFNVQPLQSALIFIHTTSRPAHRDGAKYHLQTLQN